MPTHLAGQRGQLYFKYFRQFKGKQWPSLSVAFALRLYNSYDHCVIIIITPMRHLVESGPLTQLQVLQNSRSRMFMLRVKALSARGRHWRNPRKKKNNRECSNIKAQVSVHWRAQRHAKWRGAKGFSTMLESLCTICAQCSSWHWAAHQPRKSENWDLEI